jgi:Raf kinase inhibitor-like YbhB/YbcL family protein
MTTQLTLSSPAFFDGGGIPEQYTVDGEDINPPLRIDGVDGNAKSLVLIVDGPDAATDPDGPGKTFDHWVLFNIDPDTTYIDENSVPEGAIQGKNGMGGCKYIGPAPPNGVHRYYFRLYELSNKLSLDQDATKEDVLKALRPLLLGQSQLIGKYQKALQ